jgi:SRP19 protein
MVLLYFAYLFYILQMNKAYPRDWLQVGRVRVLLRDDDGKALNQTCKTSMLYIGVSSWVVVVAVGIGTGSDDGCDDRCCFVTLLYLPNGDLLTWLVFIFFCFFPLLFLVRHCVDKQRKSSFVLQAKCCQRSKNPCHRPIRPVENQTKSVQRKERRAKRGAKRSNNDVWCPCVLCCFCFD